jgi:hypothetical protein
VFHVRLPCASTNSVCLQGVDIAAALSRAIIVEIVLTSSCTPVSFTALRLFFRFKSLLIECFFGALPVCRRGGHAR